MPENIFIVVQTRGDDSVFRCALGNCRGSVVVVEVSTHVVAAKYLKR